MSSLKHKRLMLVTDAWSPQTNGVVTTLASIMRYLPAAGIQVTLIHPGLFKTLPLPGYREIRVTRNPGLLKALFENCQPDAVHIATEGPLGLAARRLCINRGYAFTTSLHTKFPEYFKVRWGIPLNIGYRFLKWFHDAAVRTLVTTESHRLELTRWGLKNLEIWSRGVDTCRFTPRLYPIPRGQPRLLYVGRVALEKNIEAFLNLQMAADKIIVGDGPARATLQKKYPDAAWLGYRHGIDLVNEYRNADVFVFPSTTDTFGLVLLEAMACGTPVAAYPATGPIDIVINGENGCIHTELEHAIRCALQVERRSCREYALQHDWREIAERFVNSLVTAGDEHFDSAVPEPRPEISRAT